MTVNNNAEQSSHQDQGIIPQIRKPQVGAKTPEFWYEGMSVDLKRAVQLSAAIRQVLTISEQWKLAGRIPHDLKCTLLDAIYFTAKGLNNKNHKRVDDELEFHGISQKNFVLLLYFMREKCIYGTINYEKVNLLNKNIIKKYI